MKKFFSQFILLICILGLAGCSSTSANLSSDDQQSSVSVKTENDPPRELKEYDIFPGVLDFGAYSGTNYEVSDGHAFIYKNIPEDVIDEYLDELEKKGFHTDVGQAFVSAVAGEIDRNKIYVTNERYLVYLSITPEEKSGNMVFLNVINADGTSVSSVNVSSNDSSTHGNSAQSVTASTGEKNALQSAIRYLESAPFSYSGLIDQLEYEGYSHSDAVYGADNCGADWNQQAVLSAQHYLSVMPFSRSGLIEQLEYEGFTHSQAVYGVEQNGY